MLFNSSAAAVCLSVRLSICLSLVVSTNLAKPSDISRRSSLAMVASQRNMQTTYC